MHLADRRGGSGPVVERLEAVAPVGAQLLGERRVHDTDRQGGGGLLQSCQRSAVRRGEVLRECGFEDGQRLAELHRAALELAEDAEDLLGRALLQLGRDELCWTSPEA